MKKRLITNYLVRGLALLLVLFGLLVENSSANVADTRGVSEPPFLSLGTKSNLLMLLDNSGSMLDMAYTDPDSSCQDSPDDGRGYPGYDSGQIYAGYFEEGSWYSWNNGIDFWAPNTTYNNLALVYDNGIIYQAECVEVDDGTSTGTFVVPATCTSGSATTALIDDEANIAWKARPGVLEWKAGENYS